MKHILFLVILLLASFSAEAKRRMYTSELVDNSQLVAIWDTKDLPNNLMSPKTVLKGDIKLLNGATIDNGRISFILEKVKDQQIILMFSIYNKKAYIRTYLFDETSFKKNLATTKAVLAEREFLNKWKTLTAEEKVNNADLIVAGQVLDSGKVCPTNHYVKPKKVHKGEAAEKFSIIAVKENQLNKNALILLRKKPGTGPKYQAYSVIPATEAQKYLMLIKK